MRVGAPLLWRRVDPAELVQLREDSGEISLWSSSTFKEFINRNGSSFLCNLIVLRLGQMRLNSNIGNLDWLLGRNYFLIGCWGKGTVCSEKMWMLCLWRCSGQAEWGPRQPNLWGGNSVHGRGTGAEWSLRLFPTQTISLFYDSIIQHFN